MSLGGWSLYLRALDKRPRSQSYIFIVREGNVWAITSPKFLQSSLFYLYYYGNRNRNADEYAHLHKVIPTFMCTQKVAGTPLVRTIFSIEIALEMRTLFVWSLWFPFIFRSATAGKSFRFLHKQIYFLLSTFSCSGNCVFVQDWVHQRWPHRLYSDSPRLLCVCVWNQESVVCWHGKSL